MSYNKLLGRCGICLAVMTAWTVPCLGARDIEPLVRESLQQAIQAPDDEGRVVLPPGAVLDRTEWDDGLARIDLTLPAELAGWMVEPAEVERLQELLSAGLWEDPAFRGLLVRVRIGPDGEHLPLDAYLPDTPAPTSGAEPLDIAPALRAGEPGMRSPDLGQQPTGALSGVTVFAAAGHGWTAGTSSWFLQRPLLLNMIEDYGNLEQLNYFVQYLYNAGATVVPSRPVGYQNIEVVIDNDDPEVTFTGTWTNSTGSPYYQGQRTISGVHYRFASAATTESATARYTPNLPVADYYPVYTWVLSSTNRTTQKYRIVHAGGTTEMVVDHRLVGKGWVWLGNYYFLAGTGGYVEISNESAAGGSVIADAIRFGNGIGDVVGAGPGTISGYPRDEEAQRYWAESETGINAVGMDPGIYDCCSTDQSDNIGAFARWAREMNETATNNDRWRRVYLEFHSNASSGSAKGTVALITTTGATTNQALFADIMGGEIQLDMQILDGLVPFEYLWGSRSNTYTSAYGAISTGNNGNEFDATILEVAFHDNVEDAALLLDPKVRDAVARSSVHGIIKFLNALSGSTVPLAFAPVAPERVQAVHNGSGGIVVSWIAPPAGEAFGNAPTGYRIYRSTNGYGFDGGLDVGNVLTATVSDIPAGTATWLRVAAYNAGGESMPSETLAVRRSADESATFLIVNGFDRIGRTQNPSQTLSGVGTQRRPMIQHVNTRDYSVQLGGALAAAGATFDYASNEAVIAGTVSLGDYRAVAWILGEESSADSTFDATEQALVTAYLNAGGRLFVSGTEIGWDLDYLNNGRSFYNDYLKADYVSDDAGTYAVSSVAGSIFAGIAPFSFDNGTIWYDADYPDRISPLGGSVAVLSYLGGSGGTAGIAYDGSFKVVNLGFPFETVTSAATREALMDRVVGFFFPGPFDADRDGDVDVNDYMNFASCLLGPGVPHAPGHACLVHDANADLDVDLGDFAEFQVVFTGG